MKYLLGTGFFGDAKAREFQSVWTANFVRHTHPLPERTISFEVGVPSDTLDIRDDSQQFIQRLTFAGNLGHVHQLIDKQVPGKANQYCGWSGSILALAMIAYTAELDFVYREQDVVAFGPYIEQMDQELGNGMMIFGSYRHPNGQHAMPCAQSLFMIRHRFIPDFVKRYLMLPSDRNLDSLPEHKFHSIEMQFPRLVRRFSFGYDRGRPPRVPIEVCADKVQYYQHLTDAEIAALKAAGKL